MSRLLSALRHLIEGPEPGPTDRDLADLGLSRRDLALLQSGTPGARQRMEAMAAQFGLSPSDINADRGAAIDAAKACAQCGEAKACMAALRLDAVMPEANCPNTGLYRALSFLDAARDTEARAGA